MERGYIKAYRCLLDSREFQNDGLFKVWMWCLLRANYKERWVSLPSGRGYTEVHLLPGQFVTGRESASRELSMKPSTVYDRLRKLANTQNIVIDSNNQYSVITICNWDKYQSLEEIEQQPNQQPTNSQPTAIRQPSDTDKKDKKDKKEKNSILLSLFNEFYSTYPKKVGREAALKAWLKNRDVITSEYETIIASLKKQIPLWTEKQFIPNPATWINGKRWNDELIQRESLSKKCKEDEMLREFD